MSPIFDCREQEQLLSGMRQARQAIGRGELVVLPTDTVYGVAADAFDARSGKLVPFDQTVRTVSFVAGAVFAPHARVLLQYDVIADAFARDGRGVPTDYPNDTATLRLQGAL